MSIYVTFSVLHSDLQSGTYFAHDADIGVIGRGATLERAFEEAARAVFAIMSDLKSVEPRFKLLFEFEEPDRELALVTWLNMLLAKAHEKGLILSHFHLVRDGTTWRCEASGEPWRDDADRGVEVKGATLTMLSVAELEHGGWEARCVVDV